jgi:hypothetical protein
MKDAYNRELSIGDFVGYLYLVVQDPFSNYFGKISYGKIVAFDIRFSELRAIISPLKRGSVLISRVKKNIFKVNSKGIL